MAGKKNSSLDRVLGRLDTLDSVNLANLVQRLARERGLFEEIFNTCLIYRRVWCRRFKKFCAPLFSDQNKLECSSLTIMLSLV